MNTSIADVAVNHKRAPMRFIDVLVAPRYATSACTRWTSIALFLLLAGAAVVIGVVSPEPKARFAALMCYVMGISVVWWLWLSSLLLVARDARRLGLPRAGRDSAYAACLYAFAMVAAPALLVAASGGNVAAAVLFPALAVVGSLAWVLLPRWFAMWFGFVPAIYIGLHNAFHVPSPFDPRFQRWAWLALAAMAAMVLIRWRQLVRGEDNDDSRWSSAMILQMRRHAVSRDWWSMDRNWAWRRSRARRIDVDFRGIDATNPAMAIRVALGDWYVPQSWRSRTGALVRVLLPLLLFIPLMVFMTISRGASLHKLWRVVGISGGLWIGLFGSAMLALAIAALVQRRWRGSADLGLLALLPGLGETTAASHVLRATVLGPAIAFVAMWLCMLGGIVMGAPGLLAALLATLFVLEMAALMVMAVLRAMAGLATRFAMKIAIGVVLIVLGDSGFTLAFVSPSQGSATLEAAVVLGWLLLVAWTAWRGWLAWRLLQRRPHPFLATSPR
jgi:hypothetical protein